MKVASWRFNPQRWLPQQPMVFIRQTLLLVTLGGAESEFVSNKMWKGQNYRCTESITWQPRWLPSGKPTICYWKWPSRNSEFSQNGGSVHSYVNVYQRVNGNINPRIRVLGFYGDCQPPTAESMSWGRSPTADPQSSSWSREWLPPSVKHQKKCMLNDCTVWEFNVAMENHHFGIFWIRKSS